MSRDRWSTNLDELCRSLADYAKADLGGTPDTPFGESAKLSGSLYLAHSTSDGKFSAICASGYLSSAERFPAGRGESPSPRRTEVELGTADSVFFYVSPFRYPNTGCGLLFAKTLESQHANDGVAAPFDSGGLLNVFTRPDPAEPPRDFLSRHELPIPEHRRYLGLSMGVLFDRPEDYVEGLDPRRPGPIGLTGGDRRRWTHEVRIPGRVFVFGGHLQAVFASRARVAADPDIEDLFQWCAEEGVDRIPFDAPRGDHFEALRLAGCLNGFGIYCGSQNRVTRRGAGLSLRRGFSPPASAFIRASRSGTEVPRFLRDQIFARNAEGKPLFTFDDFADANPQVTKSPKLPLAADTLSTMAA
jgi:hypothetical protein